MARPGSDARSASTPLRLAAPFLLVAIGVAVYSNAFEGPFVHDDKIAILDDPYTRITWPPWRAAWAEYESPMAARPIPSLTRSWNFALGGLDPRGYKAVNLAIHLACMLALFGAVRRTLALPALAQRFDRVGTEVAFGTALLWGIHPLVSECVGYVTQRTESLMSLSFLAMIYAIARAAHPEARANEQRWRIVAVLSCAAGMASKESMVVAPLAALAFEAVYAAKPLRGWVAQRRLYVVGLAMTWLLLAALMWSNGRSGTVGGSLGIDPLVYLWNQCQVLPRYLRLALWPSGLSIDWGTPRPLSFTDVLPGFAFLSALLGTSAWAAWRWPTVGGPWLGVFALWAPTSSIVPIVTEVGADRRMYLPLAVLIAWALSGLASVLGTNAATPEGALRRRLVGAGVLALAVLCGVATHARMEDYASARTLWASTLRAFPDIPRAHSGLGVALRQDGDYDAAIASFERCIELDAELAECQGELGVTLLALGDRHGAGLRLERAAELAPGNAAISYNWAVYLEGQGEASERLLPILRDVLRSSPHHSGAAARIALQLMRDPAPAERRIERAEGLAERALREGSRPALATRAMASVSAARGDLAGAAELAERAMHEPSADPDQSALARRDRNAYRSGTRPDLEGPREKLGAEPEDRR